MKQLSGQALARLANRQAIESIFIVEIDWANSGSPISYADKKVPGIPGTILSVNPITDAVDLSSSSSQELELVLSDTDGTIKALLDAYDSHLVPASVYQYFGGLDLSDRFLLFRGKLNSPIEWSESDRTVRCTVLSQLEDREFGFSAEEGDFPAIPRDLVGKPWPAIFGTAIDVPALQVNQAVSGTTLDGVGILSGRKLQEQVPVSGNDCGFMAGLVSLSNQRLVLDIGARLWSGYDDDRAAALSAQALQVENQYTAAVAQYQQSQSCARQTRRSRLDAAEEVGQGANPVRILGGEDFPQNTPITLNVGGGLFTGKMSDDAFYISKRWHPENDETAQAAYISTEESMCQGSGGPQEFDHSVEVPPGTGDLGSSTVRRHGFIVCGQTSQPASGQVAQHFWADAGSRVVMAGDEPITYIVSIIPGTVLAVKARKTLNGVSRLVNVPNELWTVSTQTYGAISAVQLRLARPLSSIQGQGWEDDLYITFTSSVGPDVVEIIRWVVDNYSDLEVDETSFDHAATKLAAFPMSFAVLDRPNVIDLLRRIALAARCALYLSGNVVKLKYLPEEPEADATIVVSDLASSVNVSLTPTEQIVTKLAASWRLSWAEDQPERLILRRHIDKYGTHDRELDLTFYNQPDIALKAATFWLARWSTTWKRVRFQTYLTRLNIETFDTVLLDLPGYVASEPVKAVVESAAYDSDDHTIEFVCLVPVAAGKMTPETYFWPSELTLADTWPPESWAPTAGGTLPIGFFGNVAPVNWRGEYEVGVIYDPNDAVRYNDQTYRCLRRTSQTPVSSDWAVLDYGLGTVWVGGPNVIYGAGAGQGEKHMSDVAFVGQPPVVSQVRYQNVNVSKQPYVNLALNYVQAPTIRQPTPNTSATSLDVSSTLVYDSKNQEKGIVKLKEIIDRPDGGLYGAIVAYLKDDEGDEN